MANWGALTLKVFNQSLVLQDTFTNVINARGTAYLNRVGNGECTIKVQADYTAIVKGNIAVVYINDAIAATDLAVCCFTIEDIHIKTSGDGMSEVRFSGRDLLGELSGYLHFVDIGEVHATTMTEPIDSADDEFTVADIGTVKIQTNSPNRSTGDYSVYVSSHAAFSVGDDIAIETDTTYLDHISTIVSLNNDPTDGDYITTDDPFPDGIAPPKWVYVPKAFKGDSVRIELGDPGTGTWFYTRVANNPGPAQVKIAEFPTDDVANGNDIEFISGHLAVDPSVSDADITWIMETATDDGWTLDTSAAGDAVNGGTSASTSHTVDGANTLQLLINCNELTGEWFRLERTSATTAQRALAWRASSDASGITLQSPATQSSVPTVYADTTKGLIHSLTSETRWRPVTAVVAKGASDNFNLGDATNSDANFPVNLWNGVWVMTNNDAALSDYNYVHYVTFSGVEEKSSSPVSLVEAANELWTQAKAYLQDRDSAEEFKQVRTVLHADILPGQSLTLNYTETNWSDTATVYVSEVTHSVGATGPRYTDLLVSETAPYNRETAETKLVKTQTVGGSVTSTAGGTGAGGGSGGGGTTHDPVSIASSVPPGSLSINNQVLSFFLSPGDGLTESSNILAVDLSTNSGLQITSAELEMGTPSTLTPATTNSVTTTTHSHDITTTTDGQNWPSTILTTDSNGRIRISGIGINTAHSGDALRVNADLDFVGAQSITTTSGNLTLVPSGDLDVDADLEFQGAQSIKTSSGDLTIAPAGDIFIDATGDNMNFDTTVDPQGESYSAAGASAFTNQWKIDTGIGAGYFAYLEADQMHVRLFQADVTMAKANGMVVTDSVAVLSADFTIPSVSSTVAIIVDDNPALGTAQVFQADDWIRMRVFERDSGLSLYDLWGQVDSYADNGDGTQDWTLTVEYAGPGGAAVGMTVQAGATVLGYGKSGQGWWEVDARRQQGPFTRIGTWAGANPYTAGNRATNLMTGRLLSLTGNEEYGFYSGVDIDGPHVLVTDRQAEFQDIDITVLEGTGDGGAMRVYALEVLSDIESAVAPNGDISQENIFRSPSSGTWYSKINESPVSGMPDSDYIYNQTGNSGNAWFDMEDISHTLSVLWLKAYITIHSFTDDKCQIRAQMFKSDGVTTLTDEIMVASESTTAGLVAIQFTGVDTDASDAEWAAARLKLSWVYHVIGSDTILTIRPNDGINIVADVTTDDPRAYTFTDTGDNWVGGFYGGSPTSPAGHLVTIQCDSTDLSNHYALSRMRAWAGSGGEGKISLSAIGDDTSGNEAYLEIISDNDGLASRLLIQADNINTDGGLVLGENLLSPVWDPAPGELVLDGGASDDPLILCKSTDFGNAASAGMSGLYTYFQVGKLSASDCGARLKGASDSTHGITIHGSANTVTTTTSTAALAPVMLRGAVDDTTVGNTDNVVVMQNHTATKWILKGNGDVYIDGTQNTYDYLASDVEMVRASSLLSSDAIKTQFDDFVRYKRDDLERAGLVSGTFVNTTGMMKLHSGAIWELHKRIAELEDKLNAQ